MKLVLCYFSSSVKRSLCAKVAKLLLDKFGKALKGCGVTKGLDLPSLTDQILNRVRYCQKCKKRTAKTQLDLQTFTKRQCHGLEPSRDLPTDFPDGETKESIEDKRLELIEMHETGIVNKKQLKKLMDETYVAQRLTINLMKNMDLILKEWPYIGKVMPDMHIHLLSSMVLYIYYYYYIIVSFHFTVQNSQRSFLSPNGPGHGSSWREYESPFPQSIEVFDCRSKQSEKRQCRRSC